MHETTTEQQMKNKNKSDRKHDDIDGNRDKTNNERTHDEVKNNKPTNARKNINTNAKTDKDSRQLEDQAHKHNIEKPTHETPTRDYNIKHLNPRTVKTYQTKGSVN